MDFDEKNVVYRFTQCIQELFTGDTSSLNRLKQIVDDYKTRYDNIITNKTRFLNILTKKIILLQNLVKMVN